MKGTIMALRLQDKRSWAGSQVHAQGADLENLAAELTQAAYPVALRHGVGKEWLDLELDLWKAMAQTVKKWEQHAFLPLSK
jgi:hypothetical protein